VKQPTYHTQAIGSHRVPYQNDGSGIPRRVVEPEANFLDLALEESGEDSDNDDDEWEEVACPDRPLIAASSGFTLPTRGKRSELLTLEIVEDWRPLSLPPATRANDALHEGLDHRLQDSSLEADLQLEAELAKGLANLVPLVPGPSRRPRSRIQNGTKNTADAAPSTRPSVHPKLEVAERPSPMRTSAKGKGRVVDREAVEQSHKIGKRANPPRVSPAIDGQPTRKPTVSFKKKATELARSTGKPLAPSKPLPPRNPTAIPPSSMTEGPTSTPSNPSHPRTQVTPAPDLPRPAAQLFTPKGFTSHAQSLRERKTEATLQQFHERYGGVIVDHARRDLTNLMSEFASAGPLNTSKGPKPARRRQAQRTTDGKRISKAQAEAEEVMKICRSTKSYIVDLAAIRGREAATLPEPNHPAPTVAPQSVLPPPVRPEKAALGTVGQQVSKTRPEGPSSASHLPPTSLGIVPRELKFSRKQRPVPEPGGPVAEATRGGASSEWGVRGQRPVSAGRDNGPRTMDASKRRREGLGREPEGSSPRKKPRLGRY